MKEIETLLRDANSVFNDIDVAEKIINKFIKMNAVNKEKLDKNFLLFMRSDFITTDLLYSKHCNEIAWRIVKSEDTRPATNAELLNLTSSASSVAKFNSEGTLVFDKLFKLVMGYDSPAKGIYPENYKGYTDKVIDEIRKKYTISERILVK